MRRSPWRSVISGVPENATRDALGNPANRLSPRSLDCVRCASSMKSAIFAERLMTSNALYALSGSLGGPGQAFQVFADLVAQPLPIHHRLAGREGQHLPAAPSVPGSNNGSSSSWNLCTITMLRSDVSVLR